MLNDDASVARLNQAVAECDSGVVPVRAVPHVSHHQLDLIPELRPDHL